MEDKIIVANWKANKNLNEALLWVEEVAEKVSKQKQKIILCPPFIYIVPIAEKIVESGLSENLILGSQDVSSYGEGAYTGEVAASQLKNLIKYTIVGHSERRRYFKETDDEVVKKVELLLDSQITPVLCISNLVQLDSYIGKSKVIKENPEKMIFVYEPPEAISAGGEYHPDTPESANENAAKFSQRIGRKVTILYGGSLNSDNVLTFFSQKNIDGGLIGQASLDPEEFSEILEAIR